MSRRRWYHDPFGKDLHVDWSLVALTLLCWAIMVGVGMGLTAVCVDAAAAWRAQPATIACEQRQMEARRLYLRDSVICVPHPHRRDTIYLEAPPRD